MAKKTNTERSRAWRLRNPDKHYESTINWRKNNRDASLAIQRKSNKKQNAGWEQAPARHQPWELHEESLLMSGKHTDKELAVMLGRSRWAIHCKRCRINQQNGGDAIELTS